jgi:outer membrane receptor protein involved in Fe transport
MPGRFNYGSLTSDPWTQGGDWKSNQVNYFNTLDQAITRKNLLARGSFDVAGNFRVFGQVSRSQSSTLSEQLKQFNVGNLVIKAGNPLIPAAVAQQMPALGITQFTLGTMNNDIPAINFEGERTVSRYVAGVEGNFDAIGKAWNWDAYYQRGITDSSETGYNISDKARFRNALDAVTDPITGAPICRITLTNRNSGCVPYNPMGIGVNSQAVLGYLLGSPHRNQQFTQDVAAATLRGEPFGLWAGPVSLAVGIEHRREAVTGSADAISLISGWFAGNYLPTFGSYKVTEGFAETVVPLAMNLPGAHSLDLNAAVRRTNYSTSGLVTTWKLGATWQPIDDVRFRTTRSRDIRAPNLNDLFAAGTAGTNNVLDPFNNNANTAYQAKAVGNPNLKPEVADTLGVGVVLTPQFLRSFSASVDYYEIKIHDAIGNVDAQTIVNNCFEGNQAYCAAITRGVGPGGTSVITQIRSSPFNLVVLQARGLDMEASYRVNLESLVNSLKGGLTVRMLATHYLESYQNNGINPPTETAGSNATNGPPSWVYHGSITYTNNPLSITLTGRGLSSGTYSNQFTECSAGCPVSTASNPTINNNHLPGAFYVDASAAYKLSWNSAEFETFLSVQNLANRDPAIVPQGPGGLAYATTPTNPTLYDVLGRTYRAGVRIAF